MTLRITKVAMQPKPLNFILPTLLAAVLWFLPEITGLHTATDDRPFCLMGTYTLFTLPAEIARAVQFAVCIATWLYVMTICENAKIIPLRSSLPYSIGMLLSSAVAYTQYFDHHSLALILFILAFRQLLSMYSADSRLSSAFNITLLLSIAALLDPRYALLLPLFLIGMFIFRAFTPRAVLAALTGILLPAFILASACYLTDSMDTLRLICDNMHFYSFSRMDIPRSDIIMAASLFIITAISLTYCLIASVNCTLNVRLNFTLTHWSFWLSLGWLLLFLHSYTALIAVPLFFIVLCLSLYFSTNHGKASSVLLMLIIALCTAYRISWTFGL